MRDRLALMGAAHGEPGGAGMKHLVMYAGGMHRAVILAAVLSSSVLLFGACSGSDDEPPFEVVIELSAGAAAPDGFGAKPGEPLVTTEVELELSGGPRPAAQTFARTTDDDGRVTVMVESGLYEVFVRADSNDPLCGWIGSGAVTVSDGPATLILDQLWVACE